MFIDASAIVAIIMGESDSAYLVARIRDAGSTLCISPLVRFEAVFAVARTTASHHGVPVTADTLAAASELVDEFVLQLDVQIIDLTGRIGAAAVDAAMKYGKVVRHPAGLNLGDCFAYASAKAIGAPLLHKGNDFAQTDLA